MAQVDRRAELEANLDRVRQRISAACGDSGRETSEVTLVVVTKFFPASDVRILADLGVREVGESRHQEAVDKHAECAELGLVWHFIGGLQSNKAAAVTAYADVVESLDRGKLVGALSRGAGEHDRAIDVLLQVSLDPPGHDDRSGADPRDLAELAAQVEAADGLSLRGLMAVAPRDEAPVTAFARLAEVRSTWLHERPTATWLSAGMSADLEQAVAIGATHVRVGSSVLGPRPQVQ